MSEPVSVSVLTVTYNPGEFLEKFLGSVSAVDRQGIDLEVIVVDNGSTDGSLSWLRDNHPDIELLINDENNYARALNRGIARSRGEFVVISNNDATVDEGWLQGFLTVFGRDETIGAVQSKILFAGSNILNSVGVEEIEEFYFTDIGWEKEDSRRYAKAARREYVSGGSVMFRRACLEDVGPWDETFIMYMEDIDYSLRCRERGWEVWYSPDSVLHHHYHGSTSDQLCKYLCNRNRFYILAKHFPLQLPDCIASSHFFKQGEMDLLYRALLSSVRVMCEHQETGTVLNVLEKLRDQLLKHLGKVGTVKFFSHLEVVLGLRPVRVGIYDHAGHFAGGGQRYVAEMATVMQDRYEVTYIFNNEVSLDKYREWFDIDLSRCAVKILPIPFFEERDAFMPDEGIVMLESHNVFDVVARESLNYDIFINANMLGKVNPLAPVSIFVCHFPDRERSQFFQVDKYTHLVINGDYTGEWVQKRWQLDPTQRIYPPVHMYNPDSSAADKEKLILSVSRFEISESKKQVEMVQTFDRLCREHPEQTSGWKMVLAGGAIPNNTYLDKVYEAVEQAGCDIAVLPNAPVADIRDLYRRAAIFWHACGLDEERPERVEHFGMTTVEAMQNFCVPIVIDGGGQREIVEHEHSGFRFSSLEELQRYTLHMLEDTDERCRLAERAYERSHSFNRDVFRGELDKLLEQVELDLLGQDVL
ncbi:MAG: glycosyltransferase [Halioglobus sp.]|nr:glycosyltransferase [Halioglobus sp.]